MLALVMQVISIVVACGGYALTPWWQQPTPTCPAPAQHHVETRPLYTGQAMACVDDHGVDDGPYVRIGLQGFAREEGQKLAGNHVGRWMTYDKIGTLESIIQYDDQGRWHGQITEFDRIAKQRRTSTFEHGNYVTSTVGPI